MKGSKKQSVTLEYNDEWWQCPKCGGETKIVRTEQATRSCLECNWSVKIRIPESFKP